MRPDFLARFWSKVDQRGPDDCWPWTGARSAKGYGRIGVTIDGRKAGIIASRFSFLIYYGPLPPGMMACHTCDNPPCVNPAHLFAGTAQTNAQDMVAKGRFRPAAPGRRNPRPYAPAGKLSFADARLIRELHAEGQTQYMLAVQFGVSQPSISKVIRGETWRESAA